MNTPTLHGATERCPVSEALTDTLPPPQAGPLLPRKLVLFLYYPLDTIHPFSPTVPKSER